MSRRLRHFVCWILDHDPEWSFARRRFYCRRCGDDIKRAEPGIDL